MRIQPISHYPWEPQSTIRGNLAIGQLRENLIIRLREQLNGFRRYCAENGQPSPAVPEGGIHASTALCMVGALAGFAAQNAALGRAAAHSANGEPLPDSSLLMFLPSSGERFLVGNWPNAHIFQERESSIPLIMLAGGATQQAGFKPADLPD